VSGVGYVACHSEKISGQNQEKVLVMVMQSMTEGLPKAPIKVLKLLC